MTALLWPKRHQLDGLVTMDPAAMLPLTRTLSLEMLGAVVAILAIVAAADYLFQYRQWYERQKMSVRELKEEFKQTEGDPAIKAKIRQLRAEPDAQAHDGGGAEGLGHHHQPDPLCDRPAVRARHERAGLPRQGHRQHRAEDPRGRGRAPIPVVENPPLARALHATVEIDEEIPPEHYKAVAEVIGYVMRLRGAVRH